MKRLLLVDHIYLRTPTRNSMIIDVPLWVDIYLLQHGMIRVSKREKVGL